MSPDEEQLDLAGAHVVVLGWAGSTPRQLRGVVGWYERRGGRALAATADVFRAMARPRGWAEEGERLAAQIGAQARADERPIVVHLFSNAGFWMHAAALRTLGRDPAGRAVRDRIAAVVIDSAPGFPERIDPRFYARYSAMAMMPIVLRAFGKPPALTHPVLTPPVWAFMRLWYHVSPIQRRAAEESLEVVRATGDWPHLFLYSTADSLVIPTYVEAFLASLEGAGRAVEARRWEDSEHVRHMLSHRSEYFARVAGFLSARLSTGSASGHPGAPGG